MNIVNLLVSRWNARSCNKIRSIFLLPIPSFLSRRWTVYFRSSQLLPRFLHSCALLRFSSFSNYFTSFNHNNNTQFHPPDSVDGSFVVRGKCRSPETTYFTHTWFVVIQIYLLPLLSLLTYFNFMNEIEPKWNFHVDSDPFALDFMLNFVPLGHLVIVYRERDLSPQSGSGFHSQTSKFFTVATDQSSKTIKMK